MKAVRFPETRTATLYRPVIAIFGMAALMALALSWAAFGSVLRVRTVEWFIATAMCLLALRKLQEVESFSTMFLNYDQLARRWVHYGYVYTYCEALAWVLMLARALIWLAPPVAIFIGEVGAITWVVAVWPHQKQ